MPELTAEQRRNIRTALKVARQRGASPRVQKALVEAMGVESNYRHLSYGDRDSAGVLQQRPSQGWGPAGESVAKDVNDFLDRAIPANTGFAGSAGQLAQSVQRSAFPGRYDERGAEADAIRRTYGDASAKASTGPTSMTVTEGAVDNSGLRKQLVGQFLQSGGVANPNAVLALAGSYGQAADVPGTPVTYSSAQHGAQGKPARAPRLPKSGKNPWGVVDNAGRSGLYLKERFGVAEIGGYRASDPFPDHPSRKALDLMVYEDTKKGSAIARELTRNYKHHGVKYLIWNQRIWHPGEGWRKMEDRGSPTQNHKDHVHVLYE